MTPVPFDHRIAEQLLRNARLVVARSYVNNSLGNLAIRAACPDSALGGAGYCDRRRFTVGWRRDVAWR